MWSLFVSAFFFAILLFFALFFRRWPSDPDLWTCKKPEEQKQKK
jgi:hypothetical protein